MVQCVLFSGAQKVKSSGGSVPTPDPGCSGRDWRIWIRNSKECILFPPEECILPPSSKNYGSKWADDSRSRLTLWDEGPYGNPKSQIGRFEIEGFHNSTTSVVPSLPQFQPFCSFFRTKDLRTCSKEKAGVVAGCSCSEMRLPTLTSIPHGQKLGWIVEHPVLRRSS
jgi:hypothetical protein